MQHLHQEYRKDTRIGVLQTDAASDHQHPVLVVDVACGLVGQAKSFEVDQQPGACTSSLFSSAGTTGSHSQTVTSSSLEGLPRLHFGGTNSSESAIFILKDIAIYWLLQKLLIFSAFQK